jgi:hypothetical protein
VPRAAKNNNKVVEFARTLSEFCRMNGNQRLALSRQQCVLFLRQRGLQYAEQMAGAMDKNNDGMCDFKEILVQIMTVGNSNAGPRDTAKLLFDGYDRDKSVRNFSSFCPILFTLFTTLISILFTLLTTLISIFNIVYFRFNILGHARNERGIFYFLFFLFFFFLILLFPFSFFRARSTLTFFSSSFHSRLHLHGRCWNWSPESEEAVLNQTRSWFGKCTGKDLKGTGLVLTLMETAKLLLMNFIMLLKPPEIQETAFRWS